MTKQEALRELRETVIPIMDQTRWGEHVRIATEALAASIPEDPDQPECEACRVVMEEK